MTDPLANAVPLQTDPLAAAVPIEKPKPSDSNFFNDVLQGAQGTGKLIGNTLGRLSVQGDVPESVLNNLNEPTAQGALQQLSQGNVDFSQIPTELVKTAKERPGLLIGSIFVDPANLLVAGIAAKAAKGVVASANLGKAAEIATQTASDAAVFGALGSAEQTAQNFIDGKPLDNDVASAGGKAALTVAGLSGITRIVGAGAKRLISGKQGEPIPDKPPVTPGNGDFNSSDVLASFEDAPSQSPSVKERNAAQLETVVDEQLPAQNLDKPTFLRNGAELTDTMAKHELPNFIKGQDIPAPEIVIPQFIKNTITDFKTVDAARQSIQKLPGNVSDVIPQRPELLGLPAPRQEITPQGIVRPEGLLPIDEAQAKIIGRAPIVLRQKGKDLGYIKTPEESAKIVDVTDQPMQRPFVRKNGIPFKNEKAALVAAKKAGVEGKAVSVGKGFGYVHEQGFVDAKILGGLTIAGLAGLYGFNNPDKLSDIGDAALIVGGLIGAKKLAKWGPRSTNVHTSTRGLFNDVEGQLAIRENEISIAAKKIKEAIPDKFARSRMSFANEKPELFNKLSANEKQVLLKVKKDFKGMLDSFDKSGLLDKTKLSEDFINGYLPHIWKNPHGTKDSFLDSILKGDGIGTRHTKKRKIMFLEDGLKQGLEPVSMDIADIYQIYMNNASRAIMKHDAAKLVKDIPDGFGNKIIARTRKEAGEGFQPYKNQAFASAVGSKIDTVFVHPDALPSIRMMFESHNPGKMLKGFEFLNFFIKRTLVMASLFHANALAESAIYSGMMSTTIQTALGTGAGFALGDILGTSDKVKAELAAIGGAIGSIRGLNTAKALRIQIKQLREGTDNMGVQDALRHGLKVDNFEDVAVGNDQFYNALQLLGDKLDAKVPALVKTLNLPFKGIGKATKTDIKDFTGFNRAMDSFLFGRLMTGGKLAIYHLNVAKALMKAEKARAKGKQVPSDTEIKRSVAQFANDAFGGQNWRNLVENFDSLYLRDAASRLLNPNSRGFLQLALFAPDWTISNLRILGKAIPGFEKDPVIAAMYRGYAARATIYMAFMGSTIMQIATGHNPITDSRTSEELIAGLKKMFIDGVDLGDGQRMAMSKQAMEPFRWYDDPSHELVNKIGSLPKTFLNLLLQKQYVTVRGGKVLGPDVNKKDDHLFKRIINNVVNTTKNSTPIWLQQGEQGPLAIGTSFVGKPIRGRIK